MLWMIRYPVEDKSNVGYIDHGYDFDRVYNRMFYRVMQHSDLLVEQGYNVFIMCIKYDKRMEIRIQDGQTTFYVYEIYGE